MSSPLIGTWELISEERTGLIVFSERYAGTFLMDNDRQPFKDVNEPTPDELDAAFNTLRVQAGPYRLISESRLVQRRTLTRRPNSIGTDEELEYELNGEELAFWAIRPDGTKGRKQTFRKID